MDFGGSNPLGNPFGNGLMAAAPAPSATTATPAPEAVASGVSSSINTGLSGGVPQQPPSMQATGALAGASVGSSSMVQAITPTSQPESPIPTPAQLTAGLLDPSDPETTQRARDLQTSLRLAFFQASAQGDLPNFMSTTAGQMVNQDLDTLEGIMAGQAAKWGVTDPKLLAVNNPMEVLDLVHLMKKRQGYMEGSVPKEAYEEKERRYLEKAATRTPRQNEFIYNQAVTLMPVLGAAAQNDAYVQQIVDKRQNDRRIDTREKQRIDLAATQLEHTIKITDAEDRRADSALELQRMQGNHLWGPTAQAIQGESLAYARQRRMVETMAPFQAEEAAQRKMYGKDVTDLISMKKLNQSGLNAALTAKGKVLSAQAQAVNAEVDPSKKASISQSYLPSIQAADGLVSHYKDRDIVIDTKIHDAMVVKGEAASRSPYQEHIQRSLRGLMSPDGKLPPASIRRDMDYLPNPVHPGIYDPASAAAVPFSPDMSYPVGGQIAEKDATVIYNALHDPKILPGMQSALQSPSSWAAYVKLQGKPLMNVEGVDVSGDATQTWEHARRIYNLRVWELKQARAAKKVGLTEGDHPFAESKTGLVSSGWGPGIRVAQLPEPVPEIAGAEIV